MLFICWYYSPETEVISGLDKYGLSKKELVLSSDKDWQYIEAVKGKVTVLMEDEYKKLDPKEQQRENLYFCRALLT